MQPKKEAPTTTTTDTAIATTAATAAATTATAATITATVATITATAAATTTFDAAPSCRDQKSKREREGSKVSYALTTIGHRIAGTKHTHTHISCCPVTQKLFLQKKKKQAARAFLSPPLYSVNGGASKPGPCVGHIQSRSMA